MSSYSDFLKKVIGKHGPVLDLKANPEILSDIIHEFKMMDPPSPNESQQKLSSPFGVDWMDSWAANWMLHQTDLKIQPAKEFQTVIGHLTDLKFRQRIHELQEFIREYDGFVNEPPDGGPPEPGTPPAGPASIFADEPSPPDGGTPEPGVPPEPPGPGPEPGGGIMRDSPWILYWFLSIKAPLILDMIDAHFTRRMNDIKLEKT